MAKIILPGFGIAGYRSFGSEMQYSGLLGPVTLLAGQNNSGKSNFMRLLTLASSGRDELTPLDRPHGQTAYCLYSVPFDARESVGKAAVERNWLPGPARMTAELFEHPSIFRDGLTWINYRLDGSVDLDQFREVVAHFGNSKLIQICQEFHLGYVSGPEASSGLGNMRTIAQLVLPRSPWTGRGSVENIEAFRQILPSLDDDTANGNHEGLGLLPRLQRLQNPPAETYAQDTAKFAAINHFLRNILDDDTARLEVRHDARTLNVFHNGRTLPLENLGTGVHQVIILAAAATVTEGKIVCIEEPEVHLHPVYQRKFIRYLTRETGNQYLIATHSAHMLDHASAKILHVRHDGHTTSLEPAVTPSELSRVCADLGYRPSDLLQTNAVIWVEGPSDRIYISHWIRMVEPKWIEGLHYSIMFYGGGLLNHLTADDSEISDFINLRLLNRFMSIVIDSDKKSSRARLNDTKQRVRDAFDSSAMDGFAWISDGYTIENYIPEEILRSVISEVHPNATILWNGDKWRNPLELRGRTAPPDKNRIARMVCERWVEPPSNNSHLGKMIRKCVELVTEANRTSGQTFR
ncbi:MULTISPECIES: AAA family ATPase [unclassified Streptomyces]|uniref:AAA family ATPase n=1 Tax=unclassified Streptomyces TaxID=2593676 RepID=UPI00131A9D74|nr:MULTISPECIES: ATP-binding protein [unclassified Streptomyces]